MQFQKIDHKKVDENSNKLIKRGAAFGLAGSVALPHFVRMARRGSAIGAIGLGASGAAMGIGNWMLTFGLASKAAALGLKHKKISDRTARQIAGAGLVAGAFLPPTLLLKAGMKINKAPFVAGNAALKGIRAFKAGNPSMKAAAAERVSEAASGFKFIFRRIRGRIVRLRVPEAKLALS